MLATTTIRQRSFSPRLFDCTTLPKAEASAFRKELLHRSLISYAVPSERVRALVPMEFALDDLTVLSIESFLDNGRTPFEQTNFRLHVKLHGQPCSWLLGTSLGSLSGVTTRHLYPLPWHLSAMEFQVARDTATDRYQQYRLRTQSQWASATWDIVDTGCPVRTELSGEITDYFVRRDGHIGSYQTHYQNTLATRGQLKVGRCDLLPALGLLRAEELAHPQSVILQRAVAGTIKPVGWQAGMVSVA